MNTPAGQTQTSGPTGLRSVVGRHFMAARKALIGVGVFSFFINLLMLTGPLYMLQVYDRVLSSRSMSTLVAISILMAVLYAFMGFLDFCRSRVLTRIAHKFESDLGGKTFRTWMSQGSQKGRQAGGSPLADLATLRQFLSGAGPSTFFDIPWVPIYLAVIFALHWSLGVLGVIGAIIIFAIALYNEMSTKTAMVETLNIRQQETLLNEQSYRNAESIQAMGMAPALESRWTTLNQQATQEALTGSDRSGNASATSKAFRMFIQSAILGLGGALAIKQIITPGAMIAGSIILGRALAPVQMAIGQWRGFNAARNAFQRLNTSFESFPQDAPEMKLPDPKGALSAEHVMAGPPGATMATLSGVNFQLSPGDGLGIVGPSAAGKSTLARLLVGVWMPQRGTIRLDGATYDQWDRDSLGPFIGYLPQTLEMFDGTVGENIARFDQNATDEDIVKAAKQAGVHELILHLPDGYDTKLGTGGTILSGGQVQRIGLARALYGDPVLLVLDEPNSSLDADGDQALSQAIHNVRKRGCTVVVVAHRPSAIAALDKLLVLKDGRQVDFGPKDEVRARFSSPAKVETEGKA